MNSLSASWMRMFHNPHFYTTSSFQSNQYPRQHTYGIYTRWKHCCIHSTDKQSTLTGGQPLIWPHWSFGSWTFRLARWYGKTVINIHFIKRSFVNLHCKACLISNYSVLFEGNFWISSFKFWTKFYIEIKTKT